MGIRKGPFKSAASMSVSVLLVSTLCCESRARVLQVPSEYVTIQGAIDNANNGDTVLVAPGTYTGDGNRDIDFKGKSIALKSEKGPESCTIRCGGRYRIYGPPKSVEPEYHRGFYFHSHEDANSIVQGFTVTQGYMGTQGGGAFYCAESSPTIRDCIITENVAIEGGGITAYRSRAQIENCIVAGNIASAEPRDWFYNDPIQRGGGVALYGESRVVNCLVVGNVATQGGGIYCTGSHQFVNCTVAGNRTGKGGLGGGISCGPRGSDLSHLCNSIVWGNSAVYTGNDVDLTGEPIPFVMKLHVSNSLLGKEPNDVHDPYGRISGRWLVTNPLFANDGYWDPNGTLDKASDDFWVEGDYHLKSQGGRWDPNNQSWVKDEVTSPCIDTGDPNSPIGYEPFPNGGRINMGAYGGTAEASKSYFGEPVCETIIAGDINGDCRVDLKDLILLVAHWSEGTSPNADEVGNDQNGEPDQSTRHR